MIATHKTGRSLGGKGSYGGRVKRSAYCIFPEKMCARFWQGEICKRERGRRLMMCKNRESDHGVLFKIGTVQMHSIGGQGS